MSWHKMAVEKLCVGGMVSCLHTPKDKQIMEYHHPIFHAVVSRMFLISCHLCAVMLVTFLYLGSKRKKLDYSGNQVTLLEHVHYSL